MNNHGQIVVSASRRTDIPAFYMPWFMDQIEKGYFENVNPFNRNVSIVAASPQHVHSIVFWSKNFEPFITNDYGRRLQHMGYHLFFNFTINSETLLLEPRVPPLRSRFEQLNYLCREFGPQTVNWRFDPICFYETDRSSVRNNLSDFLQIADVAAQVGIRRCITSFMDFYPKIGKRIASISNFRFIAPALTQKTEILSAMEKTLAARNIRLYTCCEKDILPALADDSTIRNSSCISNHLLVQLYGGTLSFKRDTGQRMAAGCGCTISVDIGSYQHQPCYHSCLFCYANPAAARASER